MVVVMVVHLSIDGIYSMHFAEVHTERLLNKLKGDETHRIEFKKPICIKGFCTTECVQIMNV